MAFLKTIFVFFFLLLVFDASGQVLLQKLFGNANCVLSPNSLIKTADNNILITAGQYCSGMPVKGLLLKLDSTGNQIWAKIFSDTSQNAYSGIGKVIQLDNSDLLFVGNSGVSGNFALNLLIRTDASGNILAINALDNDTITWYDILESPDGTLMFCGERWLPFPLIGPPYPVSNFLLMKTDANLNILWSKLYKNRHREYFYDIESFPDGNYLLQGYSFDTTVADPGSDIFLIKMDTSGDVIWAKQCGGSVPPPSGNERVEVGKILILPSGEIINAFTACWFSPFNTGDLILQKLDTSGNEIFSRLYDCCGEDGTSGILPLSNGDFVFTNHIVILKTDSDFNFQWAQNAIPLFPSVTPNGSYYGLEKSYNEGFVYTVAGLAGGHGYIYYALIDSNGFPGCSNIPITFTNQPQNIPTIDITPDISDSIIFLHDTIPVLSVNPISFTDSVLCLNYTGIPPIEKNKLSDFQIMPNLIFDVFSIKNNSSNSYNFRITDILGRFVLSRDNIQNKILQINLNKQSQGIYFLIIYSSDKKYSYKIIKQ